MHVSHRNGLVDLRKGMVGGYFPTVMMKPKVMAGGALVGTNHPVGTITSGGSVVPRSMIGSGLEDLHFRMPPPPKLAPGHERSNIRFIF